MEFSERYSKNLGALTSEDCALIRRKKACVVGCGGHGGHIIEMLARLGFGCITAVDGDVFNQTNLNRQLLSSESNIGMPKVHAAVDRIKAINSEVLLFPIHTYLDKKNAEYIIEGHDIVFDALDTVEARRVLQTACRQKSIPLIHGAASGWHGQVSTILPGDDSMDKIYPIGAALASDEGNPPFAPPIVAAAQVAESIKLLCGKGQMLRRKLLLIDLLLNNTDIIDL